MALPIPDVDMQLAISKPGRALFNAETDAEEIEVWFQIYS